MRAVLGRGQGMEVGGWEERNCVRTQGQNLKQDLKVHNPQRPLPTL